MIDDYLSQAVTSRVEHDHGDPSHLKCVGSARSRPLLVSESTFAPLPLKHWAGTSPGLGWRHRIDAVSTKCDADERTSEPGRSRARRFMERSQKTGGPGMTDLSLSTFASWSALSCSLLAIEGALTPFWQWSSGPRLHPSDLGACERPPRRPQFHRGYRLPSPAPRRA